MINNAGILSYMGEYLVPVEVLRISGKMLETHHLGIPEGSHANLEAS